MQANTLYGVGLSAERLEEFAAAAGTGCGPVVADLPADKELDGATVLAATLEDEGFAEIISVVPSYASRSAGSTFPMSRHRYVLPVPVRSSFP